MTGPADLPPGLRATWDQLHAEIARVRREYIRTRRTRMVLYLATAFQFGAFCLYAVYALNL